MKGGFTEIKDTQELQKKVEDLEKEVAENALRQKFLNEIYRMAYNDDMLDDGVEAVIERYSEIWPHHAFKWALECYSEDFKKRKMTALD